MGGGRSEVSLSLKSTDRMGKKRTQTVMVLLDIGTQAPPYLFPWAEGTLNSSDGIRYSQWVREAKGRL